ncbi:probable glutamate receptor [Diachasma alloeum]|uniref:Ionotropic receptor 105 n=1 Tax=Diachasma alloeum TaxID=454923 RepID=A0A4E0S4G9_9HYME|nr:probable glutamate receptor [Diachasma alloeum]THK33023.1 ionotropic receptor 105 [Diachasma alloeum]
MKFAISTIFLSVSIVIFCELSEAYYYAPVIKDVHNQFGRTEVIIVVPQTNHFSFENIMIWHETTRTLSNEGISVVILNTRPDEKLKIYSEKTTRSLIVIALDTIEELHAFESITKDLHMSYAIWLIFFTKGDDRDVCEFCRNPHKSLSDMKLGSRVLISCCTSNTIEEWRYDGKNHTERQELGRFKKDDRGIVWFSNEQVADIHGGIYSLAGRGLRIVVVKRARMFWEKDGYYYGVLGEILRELSQAMNFTVSEIIWEDDYGVWNPETSSWTGAVGMIHRREADLGVSDFLFSIKRTTAIAFTTHFTSADLYLYLNKDYTARLHWNAYFKLLSMDVWMVIFGLILITTILLTLINYTRRSHFFPLLFQHYLYAWSIYCYQALPKFPEGTPSRIVYGSILLSSMAIISAYGAVMTSRLTVVSYIPFKTLQEFVDDGSFHVIKLNVSQNFDQYEFFDQTLAKKMMSLMMPTNTLPLNDQEVFEQVCSKRVGYYLNDMARKAIEAQGIRIPCELSSIKYGKTQILAMIMPQGSRYLDLVNYYILQFRTNGMMERLEHKYYKEFKRNDFKYSSVSLPGVAPLLLILAIGFLIALIIFIIEQNANAFRKKLLSHQKRRTTFLKTRKASLFLANNCNFKKRTRNLKQFIGRMQLK